VGTAYGGQSRRRRASPPPPALGDLAAGRGDVGGDAGAT
jgi:hypothetical protein